VIIGWKTPALFETNNNTLTITLFPAFGMLHT